MHVAPRIAVHSWQDAPDVVPDMPQTWEGEGKADFI